jgi:Putative transposase
VCVEYDDALGGADEDGAEEGRRNQSALLAILHVASELHHRRPLAAAHVGPDLGRRHFARAGPGVDDHRRASTISRARELGAEIGVLAILHTWGQTLVRHPHVHCVVPAGGLTPDHQRWVHPKYAGFFLPVKVLSRIFRGKFVEQLRRAYTSGEFDLTGANEHLRDPVQWHAFIDALFQTDWVVYAKPAFGGASAVLRYLGRYTHRVAISNHRLRAFDGERVTFQWKDYAQGGQSRTMTLSAMEFLRRFVQHILPRGFVRIRQSGFLANTCRTARLALARTLLRAPRTHLATSSTPTEAPTPATWTCPRCGAVMTLGPILSRLQLMTITLGFDSS